MTNAAITIAPSATEPAKRERKPPQPATVEDARAELERYHEQERLWSRRRMELAARIEEVDEASGAEVLEAAIAGDGNDALAKAAMGSAELRAQLAVAERTIDAARARRIEAIRRLWRLEAGALRAQARALRVEADAREPETRRLLEALEAWEECRYAPAEPERPPTQPILTTLPDEQRPDSPGGWPRSPMPPLAGLQVIVRRAPKSEVLRIQAAELERQAKQVDARQLEDRGHVVAQSIAALVELILDDPLRIGPRVPDVVAWAQSAAAAELERRQQVLTRQGSQEAALAGHDKPLHFTLTWAGGTILPQQSRATAPQEA